MTTPTHWKVCKRCNCWVVKPETWPPESECTEVPDASTKQFFDAQVVTFEAGPDECDTGVALTKAIDAVLAEDTPLVNHTIERCAQVAENFKGSWYFSVQIAAAIRKLKETI